MALPSRHPSPPEDLVRAFATSMPEGYGERFGGEDVREHAAIVSRRGGARAYVEIWQRLPGGGAVVAVVADDRPGLLSLISAALVAHDLDVVAAQAYCRAVPRARTEAVDLFWLRRASHAPSASGIDASDVAHVQSDLDALLRGAMDVDSIARHVAANRRAGAATRVRFEDPGDRGLTVLSVETDDRPGLLLELSRALFRQRVQIVRSEVGTQNGRVVDRFYVAEFDGAPVRTSRRAKIQAEVLGLIEALQLGMRPPG